MPTSTQTIQISLDPPIVFWISSPEMKVLMSPIKKVAATASYQRRQEIKEKIWNRKVVLVMTLKSLARMVNPRSHQKKRNRVAI
jgi:hypothetical protein